MLVTNYSLHLEAATLSPLTIAEKARLKETPEQRQLRSLVRKYETLIYVGQKSTPLAKETRAQMKKLRHNIKKQGEAQSKIKAAAKKAGILQVKADSAQKVQAIVRGMLAKKLIPKLKFARLREREVEEEQAESARKGREEQLATDQAKAERKAVKKERRKLTQAAARKLSMASVIPPENTNSQRLEITMSKAFKDHIFIEGHQNKVFSGEQKRFIELIYESDFPMYPELIYHFGPSFYRMAREFTRKNLSSERLDEILFEKEDLPLEKYKEVYTFIEKNRCEYSGSIGDGIKITPPSFYGKMINLILAAIQRHVNEMPKIKLSLKFPQPIKESHKKIIQLYDLHKQSRRNYPKIYSGF
jgi:hypothetical protein